MKRLILSIFFAMLANNAMEEKPSQQPANAITSLILIRIILPGAKHIMVGFPDYSKLGRLTEYLAKEYSTSAIPLPAEEQKLRPVIHPCTSKQFFLSQLIDNPNVLITDLTEEFQTDTFMVTMPLKPLSNNLNNKIATLITNKKATSKN